MNELAIFSSTSLIPNTHCKFNLNLPISKRLMSLVYDNLSDPNIWEILVRGPVNQKIRDSNKPKKHCDECSTQPLPGSSHTRNSHSENERMSEDE